jgi:bacterioferritin (cytochrome b1)
MKSINELINKDQSNNKAEEKIVAEDATTYSNTAILESLKESVDIHWQQAMELTGQSAHLNRWGYKKLGNLFAEYAKEEHDHAAVAISRLEFFDTDYQPLSVSPRVWKRHDVRAIIEFNLEGVRKAAVIEKRIIAQARMSGDEITAQEIIPLLRGSDDGILEFEKMLRLIDDMGLDNFLTLIAKPT